jgi:large subunit ribosomal protein L4
MNRKEKQAALKSALTSKLQNEKLIVLDELKLDEIKTKRFAEVMNAIKAEKALVVLGERDENVILSARNLPDTKTAVSDNINVYDVMSAGTLVLTKAAVANIEEVYA